MRSSLRAKFQLAAVLAILLVPSPAPAQLIVTSSIDELCKSAPAVTSRKTIVYVDLFSLKKGEAEWGLTILNKLELGARELLTILGVNPTSFEITDAFESCYPIFTKGEMESDRAGRGWWEKLTKLDPDSQQRENLQTFDARVRNGLDRLLNVAASSTPGKRRNMMGAIAVDKNRFTDRQAFYRVIIYTDGSLADSMEGGSDENQVNQFLAKKYPASFSGAEVSIYGVTGNDKDMPLELKSRIYSAFFMTNWARLRSFSLSLMQQKNEIYSPVKLFSGDFEGGGIGGPVKLNIAQAKSSTNADVWVTFIVGGSALYVPFEGEYFCDRDVCTLKATCLDNIPFGSANPYFRKGDQLALSGKSDGILEGFLRSEAKEKFKDANEEVRYSLKFSGR